jgi:hypothetical protein
VPTLHIEHRVADFEHWKRDAFDADPIGRVRSGVRGHRVTRAADDPNFVMIDLDFATMSEAEAMQAALRNLWQNPLVQIGSPQARIMETVETKDY